MGMPVSVELVGGTERDAEALLDRFRAVDERFSTYKETSEISRINRDELSLRDCSEEMKEVLALCEKTKRATGGYFDIETPGGALDPSGLVKGWAIRGAAELAERMGYENFYIEAGGDIQTSGENAEGNSWKLGIRNPRNRGEIVKVIVPRGKGVATSGSYVRGRHVYDPHTKKAVQTDILSLTIIGPDVYEADRFATAAFAMGEKGLSFIELLDGFEGFSIDAFGIGVETSGFKQYL